jgi:hypothetical protein
MIVTSECELDSIGFRHVNSDGYCEGGSDAPVSLSLYLPV